MPEPLVVASMRLSCHIFWSALRSSRVSESYTYAEDSVVVHNMQTA